MTIRERLEQMKKSEERMEAKANEWKKEKAGE